jgi:hypothetical protein
MIDALSELQAQKFVEINGETGKPIAGSAIRALNDDFRRMHAGREEQSYGEGRVTWRLDAPLPGRTKIPMPSWRLTDLGVKAVDIILKAVSTELAPKPLPKGKRAS